MPSWTQVCITERRAKDILDALRDRGGLRFFEERSPFPAVMFYSDAQRVGAGRILIWDTRVQPPPRLQPSQVGDFFVGGGEFIQIIWGRDSTYGSVGLFRMCVHPPNGLVIIGGEPSIARELVRPTTDWIRRMMKKDTLNVPGEYMRISPECVRRLRDVEQPPAWLARVVGVSE